MDEYLNQFQYHVLKKDYNTAENTFIQKLFDTKKLSCYSINVGIIYEPTCKETNVKFPIGIIMQNSKLEYYLKKLTLNNLYLYQNLFEFVSNTQKSKFVSLLIEFIIDYDISQYLNYNYTNVAKIVNICIGNTFEGKVKVYNTNKKYTENVKNSWGSLENLITKKQLY